MKLQLNTLYLKINNTTSKQNNLTFKTATARKSLNKVFRVVYVNKHDVVVYVIRTKRARGDLPRAQPSLHWRYVTVSWRIPFLNPYDFLLDATIFRWHTPLPFLSLVTNTSGVSLRKSKFNEKWFCCLSVWRRWWSENFVWRRFRLRLCVANNSYGVTIVVASS